MVVVVDCDEVRKRGKKKPLLCGCGRKLFCPRVQSQVKQTSRQQAIRVYFRFLLPVQDIGMMMMMMMMIQYNEMKWLFLSLCSFSCLLCLSFFFCVVVTFQAASFVLESLFEPSGLEIFIK